MATHNKNWHTQLFNALWADRVNPKAIVGNSPYHLVYGKEAILSSNLLLPSLQMDQYFLQYGSSPLQHMINSLLKLEEDMEKTKNKMCQHQQLVKRWFDEKYSTDRISK